MKMLISQRLREGYPPTSGSLDKVIESEYGVRSLFRDVSADIDQIIGWYHRHVLLHPYLAMIHTLLFLSHLDGRNTPSGGRFNVSGVCIAGIPLP